MTAQRVDSTYEPAADEKLEQAADDDAQRDEPGLVLVFAAGHAACVPLPCHDGALELGRDHQLLQPRRDPTMSRRHASVLYRQRAFEISELGSRNGSAIDGTALHGCLSTEQGQLLRLGHSLFLLKRNVAPFVRHGVQLQDERVEGPALQRISASIASLSQHSRILFISGASGAGKEALALAFHRSGPQRTGAFVAVNCATLPEGLAERLLFGSQKGAYSGASSDSQGYVQAASGGTLFLDEVAELDLAVQAKLLRVLASGEVSPLGTTRPRKIDLRVCSATNADLRALAGAGKFRPDLYFRLGVPQVHVPPLCERLEEIPWLLQRAVHQVDSGLRIHASFVEACLLRAWPGNVRELLAEAHTGALRALTSGSSTINAQHLGANAGMALGPAAPPQQNSRALSPDAGSLPGQSNRHLTVLLSHRGNISAAARELGLHRTQLRRILDRQGVDLNHIRKLLP